MCFAAPAAFPASKTPVFTAPARKRLQQHMQKHGKYHNYCSRSLKTIHKHAKTHVLLLRLAKDSNNTCENTIYTAMYCSGTQKTNHKHAKSHVSSLRLAKGSEKNRTIVNAAVCAYVWLAWLA